MKKMKGRRGLGKRIWDGGKTREKWEKEREAVGAIGGRRGGGKEGEGGCRGRDGRARRRGKEKGTW